MDELRAFYGIRLQAAIDAVHAVAHRTSIHAVGPIAEESAMEAVREVDRWYAAELDELYGSVRATAPLDESGTIGWHRGEIGALLDECEAVVIAGGNVRTLLRTLRVFDVTFRPEQSVVAWSAGAMALTDEVVLFHDFTPHGVAAAELHDRGLGRLPGIVALPHAKRRLLLDDHERMSVLARRFAEHRLLLLDDGAVVRFPDGATELPAGARVHRPHRPRLGGGGRVSAMERLAVNRLRERLPLDGPTIDRFVERYGCPIIEGERATFLYRGDVDEVWVRHRVVGLPDPLPLKRIGESDLWAVTTVLPEGSRVEYQIEIRKGEHYERFNDPLNPRLAHSPMGSSSVCAAIGYRVPEWVAHDPEARPGTLVEEQVHSKALRRDQPVQIYLPARFNRAQRYPLLVVHDGTDYLQFAAMKTVLDNLIHRLDVDPLVAVFVPPRDRLKEYPNHAPHARFIARELVPLLTERLPLIDTPEARCLMGSSFGGIASLSTAVRYPGFFGSLMLQSASLVFTDIGFDHGGGPAFDPVVKFVNRFREKPSAVVDRLFMSCGVYEPLITPNRSMVPVFRHAGMTVRYTESRDGHNWENWRDRLGDGLAWLFPGPQKFVYE